MAFLPKIERIHFASNLALPTVYSDSLSYLEDIDRLYIKINDFIDKYNVLIEYYNGLSDLLKQFEQKITEIDTALANLRTWQEQITTSINNQIASLQAKLEAQIAAKSAELEKLVDDSIAEMRQELTTAIQNQITYINNLLNEYKTEMDDRLDGFEKDIEKDRRETKAWLQAQIDHLLTIIPQFENVHVINPATGELQNIQDVVNDLYDRARPFAMTAAEYDSLGLTADEYDNWFDVGNSIGPGVTAERYDEYGRIIFYLRIRRRIPNQVTGKFVSPKLIMRQNTDLLRAPGALTAEEYDALKLTAEEYDAKMLTAYEYDWLSNRYLSND